jgi:hypothetical protein
MAVLMVTAVHVHVHVQVAEAVAKLTPGPAPAPVFEATARSLASSPRAGDCRNDSDTCGWEGVGGEDEKTTVMVTLSVWFHHLVTLLGVLHSLVMEVAVGD